MKILSTLAFCTLALLMPFTVLSQCSPNPYAFFDCQTASDHVVTDFAVFDNVCFEMFSDVSPGMQPTPLCPNDGAPGNISWIAFEAPAGLFEINITPFDCLGSTLGNEGIQVGVYSDCTFSNSLYCNSSCNLSTVVIPTNDMVGGDVYYLFVDGCNGAVCKYEVEFSLEGTLTGSCQSDVDLLFATHEDCEQPVIVLRDSLVFDEDCTSMVNQCDATGLTQWHQLVLDDPMAEVLVTQVLADSFDVTWSVYYGDDVETATRLQGINHVTGGPYSCSSSDGIADNVHVVPLFSFAPSNYWLAVTATSEIVDPNYVVNYYSTYSCSGCLGEDQTNFNVGNIEAFVDGVKTDGPFCPGQLVTICVEQEYGASASGNNWLHGIIPVFGSGWDVESADLEDIRPLANSEWFDSDGPCAPRLNGYNVPNICTYMEDGVLKMKNIQESPDTDCIGLLTDGSPLPSGWFINTAGGSPTCAADCSPASFYGVSGGITVVIDFCFDIRVDMTDVLCEDGVDLQIKFFSTSDALTGCWEDQEPCARLVPLVSAPWEISCDDATISTIAAENVTICSGGSVDQLVSIVGDSDAIEVSFDNNANITGEGSGPDWSDNELTIQGSGSIGDVLINTGDDPEVVTYYLRPAGAGSCSAGARRLEVTVLAPIVINFTEEYAVCAGGCVMLSPTVTSTGLEDASWSEGSTGISATVCPTETTTYSLTLMDGQGCTNSADVTVLVPDSIFTAIDTSICEGQEVFGFEESGSYEIIRPSSESCDTIINLQLTVQANPMTEISVSICEGEVATIGDLTFDTAGQYELTLQSALGCDSIVIADVTLLPLPTLSIGMDVLCVGDAVQATPTGGLMWTSDNSSVCTVTNDGIITAVGSGTVQIIGTDETGCSNALSLTVLATDDPACDASSTVQLANAVTLYPNPASSDITVVSEATITNLTIVGADGRVHALPQLSGRQVTVPVHELPAGVYMLQVQTERGLSAHKVLVVE